MHPQCKNIMPLSPPPWEKTFWISAWIMWMMSPHSLKSFFKQLPYIGGIKVYIAMNYKYIVLWIPHTIEF